MILNIVIVSAIESNFSVISVKHSQGHSIDPSHKFFSLEKFGVTEFPYAFGLVTNKLWALRYISPCYEVNY